MSPENKLLSQVQGVTSIMQWGSRPHTFRWIDWPGLSTHLHLFLVGGTASPLCSDYPSYAHDVYGSGCAGSSH